MGKPDDSDDDPIPLRRADNADLRRRDAYEDEDKEQRSPRRRRLDDEEEERPHRRRPGYARRRDDEDDYEDEYEEDEEEGVIRQLVPTENPKALVAYYCAIFGLIPPFGLVLGPLGLLFGILGLRKASKDPKGKGGGHSLTGIILGPIVFLLSLGAVIGAYLYLRGQGVSIKDVLDT